MDTVTARRRGGGERKMKATLQPHWSVTASLNTEPSPGPSDVTRRGTRSTAYKAFLPRVRLNLAPSCPGSDLTSSFTRNVEAEGTDQTSYRKARGQVQNADALRHRVYTHAHAHTLTARGKAAGGGGHAVLPNTGTEDTQ